MRRVSRKQLVILEAIENHIKEHRHAPTVRELATAVGLSSASTAHVHLSRLKEQGYIQWEPDCPRTIKIVKQGGDRDA